MGSSWEGVSEWYGACVGETGHYYHEHVIFPALKKAVPWDAPAPHLLDLACGSSPLLKIIPKTVAYTGVDLSPSLIQQAKKRKTLHTSQWVIGDITQPLKLPENHFSHAAIILALQNVQHPAQALKNAAKHLRPGGSLILVLNHPAFRIPRQSEWHVDEKRNLQQRCISSYMSSMEIPIQTNPGKNKATVSAYHFPLSELSRMLFEAGFAVEKIDEWCSDKISEGKAARRENRARKEFPLFLALYACKKNVGSN